MTLIDFIFQRLIEINYLFTVIGNEQLLKKWGVTIWVLR